MVAQWVPGRIEAQERLRYRTGRIGNREQMFKSRNRAIGLTHLCFSASKEFFDAWRHNRIVNRGRHGERTFAFAQSGFFVAETGISGSETSDDKDIIRLFAHELLHLVAHPSVGGLRFILLARQILRHRQREPDIARRKHALRSRLRENFLSELDSIPVSSLEKKLRQ